MAAAFNGTYSVAQIVDNLKILVEAALEDRRDDIEAYLSEMIHNGCVNIEGIKEDLNDDILSILKDGLSVAVPTADFAGAGSDIQLQIKEEARVIYDAWINAWLAPIDAFVAANGMHRIRDIVGAAVAASCDGSAFTNVIDDAFANDNTQCVAAERVAAETYTQCASEVTFNEASAAAKTDAACLLNSNALKAAKDTLKLIQESHPSDDANNQLVGIWQLELECAKTGKSKTCNFARISEHIGKDIGHMMMTFDFADDHALLAESTNRLSSACGLAPKENIIRAKVVVPVSTSEAATPAAVAKMIQLVEITLEQNYAEGTFSVTVRFELAPIGGGGAVSGGDVSGGDVASGRRLRRALNACEGFVDSLADVPDECKVAGLEVEVEVKDVSYEAVTSTNATDGTTSIGEFLGADNTVDESLLSTLTSSNETDVADIFAGVTSVEAVVFETASPTVAPTRRPTKRPTVTPGTPTEAPTDKPTGAPTKAPTKAPTEAPTEEPTGAPTKAPTKDPTKDPTSAPTTDAPTPAPTAKTGKPTYTAKPTTKPPTTKPPTKPPTIGDLSAAPGSSVTSLATTLFTALLCVMLSHVIV